MNKFFICDCHNDFLTELDSCGIESYLKTCKQDRVKFICSSFWSSKMNKAFIKNHIKKRADLIRESEICLFHVEDLWWVEDKTDLTRLLCLKPFSCSLTWNDSNSLAGGANSTGGLSKWGKFCVEELQKNGILIDTAHLNRKSFYQVAGQIKKNIFCSHTAFYGMKRHKRNLTDKQIDMIVGSNGFIGMFFYHKALKSEEEFSVCDIVKNLKYFTSRWGCDNVGFGSDFYGIDVCPKGLNSYQNFDNLFCAMKDEGFSDVEIEKIFYKNFLDFLERTKKERAK